MKLIKDLGMIYPTSKSKTQSRYGIYECSKCGNHEKKSTYNVKKRGTSLCNECSNKSRGDKNRKHGYRSERVYSVYTNMKSRCYNENSKSFKDYGAKGVVVCDEWVDNPQEFIEWAISNGYNNTLTIDRINPYGNYEPSNCRFVGKTVQSQNTRLLSSTNRSGYRGVSWNKAVKQWVVYINVDKKCIYLGKYDCKIDGAVSYNNYVIDNNLNHPLNKIQAETD